MALVDTAWYVSSVASAAVTARPQNAAVAAGQIVRQFTAPALNNERCFACIVAGTTGNVADATWTLTRGAKTVDGTATWQEVTGQPAINGDLASTATWAQVKAAGSTLGQIIKRSNNASYQICTTAGAMSASEPAFSDTAGATTTDGSCTWTSLGVVGNFPAWGASHARLNNAYASGWGAAGHKFWLADNHAETQAADVTFTSPATGIQPTYTICVDRTAALPPVEANFNTGASITTNHCTITGSTGAAVYFQGIRFNAGSGTQNFVMQNSVSHTYRNCAFVLGAAVGSGVIFLGASGSAPSFIIWDNCTVQLGHINQHLRVYGTNFEWRNTPSAIQGATFPSSLFWSQINSNGIAVCRGVDFSAFPNTLVSAQGATPFIFEDCKFHASVTRLANLAAVGYGADPVITVRCDSGATNYKSTRDEYSGTQTVETSIMRVGGATDGTTATSYKIVTNAQATFLMPYRMLPLAIWNETVGADVTVTVCGTINSASLPLNDELWMDVQYLGSAGSPIASFKTTSKSQPLAVGAAIGSDGSAWNGGGSGAGWSPFKLVAILTSPQPQMKGYLYINVRAAKASTTYYIDPQVTLS